MGLESLITAVAGAALYWALRRFNLLPNPTPAPVLPTPAPAPFPTPLPGPDPAPAPPSLTQELAYLLREVMDRLLRLQEHSAGVLAPPVPFPPPHQITLPIQVQLKTDVQTAAPAQP